MKWELSPPFRQRTRSRRKAVQQTFVPQPNKAPADLLPVAVIAFDRIIWAMDSSQDWFVTMGLLNNLSQESSTIWALLLSCLKAGWQLCSPDYQLMMASASLVLGREAWPTTLSYICDVLFFLETRSQYVVLAGL